MKDIILKKNIEKIFLKQREELLKISLLKIKEIIKELRIITKLFKHNIIKHLWNCLNLNIYQMKAIENGIVVPIIITLQNVGMNLMNDFGRSADVPKYIKERY